MRISKGYSQEYMAILLGIDTATYGRMERGQIKITIDRLVDITKILKIPLEKLIGEESEKHTLELILNEIKSIREINEKLLETFKTQCHENYN